MTIGASRISRNASLISLACICATASTPASAQAVFGAIDAGFPVFSDNGSALANPDIAVGTSTIVAVASGEIAWYDKNNQLLGSMPLWGAGGLWSNVGGTDRINDPQVVWNPIAQSFYVAATRQSDAGDEDILTAFTLTDDPSAGWATQQNSFRSLGFNAEHLSLGNKGDGIYFTVDFDPSSPIAGCWMGVADRARLSNNDRISHYTQLSNTPRGFAVNESDRVAGTELLSVTINSGGFAKALLTGWNTTSPDGMLVYNWIDLPWHFTAPPIEQPVQGFDLDPGAGEFRSSKEQQGSLWTVHTVKSGDHAVVRWYEIDLNGWPNSGQTPSLRQYGDIDPGPGVSAFLPDIAVDSLGNAAIVFSISSADQNIAIARAVRFAGDPLGEFRQHRIIHTSNSVETSGVWGSYVGIEADPTTPGVFWSHAPYRTDGWQTWIGKVTLAQNNPPSDGPRLYAPDNGFIHNIIPALRWDFNELASGFHVMVSTDPGFQINTFTSDVIQENSYVIPDGVLDCNTRYYWRVVAETSQGEMMSDPDSRWFERRYREDLNRDGIVDSADIGMFISAFRASDLAADFNDDGVINSADLGVLIGAFGGVCE